MRFQLRYVFLYFCKYPQSSACAIRCYLGSLWPPPTDGITCVLPVGQVVQLKSALTELDADRDRLQVKTTCGVVAL